MIDDYPKQIDLPDGSTVRVGVTTRTDEARLRLFFLTVPEEDRDFLPYDLTDADAIEGWFGGPNWAEVFPLVAERNNRIIGVGVLKGFHTTWSAHIGEGWMIVAPTARGTGIGRILATEMFNLADELGIEQLMAYLRAENITGVEMFRNMGYVEQGRFHNYIKDAQGGTHDLLVLSCSIKDYTTRLSDSAKATLAEDQAREAGILTGAVTGDLA